METQGGVKAKIEALLSNQKALAIIALVVGIMAVGSVVIYAAGNRNKVEENGEGPAPTESELVTEMPTSTPGETMELSPTVTPFPEIVSVTPTTKPTGVVTATPTTKPTVAATATPTESNPYDLNAATGSIKVTISASSGSLIGDQIVELWARAGYKVLVNKSTDHDTAVARQGSPEVVFSQVPPGPYAVKVKYKDSWTGFSNTDVKSGQQAMVTVSVVGEVAAAPTATLVPTEKPKPSCNNPTAYPGGGAAPLAVVLSPGGAAGSAGAIEGYEWDFTGDGSWDTGVSLNAQNYTYLAAGTYTAKMRVKATNGEYSGVCGVTITVN